MISKRDLLANVLNISGMNRLLRVTSKWSGLLVLNYHRIGELEKSNFDRALYSADAETFEEQVHYLSKNFDLIGADDLADVFNQKSGQYVMITFDDGYRDNYEAAFPILKSHNAPALFFITTGYLDNQQVPWWDDVAWMIRSATSTEFPDNQWLKQPLQWGEQTRETIIHRLLKCYKQLSPTEVEPYLNFIAEETNSGRCSKQQGESLWMTWDMIREMRTAGMSFGGHTVNHPVLSTLNQSEQNNEIAGCKLRLEEELQETIEAFSYPVGGTSAFNEITQQCLKENGYRWAFSYYGGYCNFRDENLFDLPRIAVEDEMSLSLLRSMTSLPQVFA